MSAMIDSPVRHVNRHRAHSLRPGPGRDAVPVTDPVTEESWDDRNWADKDWDDKGWDADATAEVTTPVLGPALAPALAPTPQACTPVPTVRTRPAVGPSPAAQPCDGLAEPPRRTVGPFPPIRAGGGRHRLPAAVRRRPGPIAAGLMVAATTLAAGTLRFSAPAPLRTAADAGHQCGPLLPGEPCE